MVPPNVRLQILFHGQYVLTVPVFIAYLVHELFGQEDPEAADLTLRRQGGNVRVLPGQGIVGHSPIPEGQGQSAGLFGDLRPQGGLALAGVYDSKNEYNTLNVGATGGFTAYWGDVFFSARYTLGLVDVLQLKTPYNDTSEGGEGVIKYTYDDVKSSTSSVQLTVGYRIR